METNLIPVSIKLATTPYFHRFTLRRMLPLNSILMLAKNILSMSQLLYLNNAYVLQLKQRVYISQYLHMHYNSTHQIFS